MVQRIDRLEAELITPCPLLQTSYLLEHNSLRQEGGIYVGLRPRLNSTIAAEVCDQSRYLSKLGYVHNPVPADKNERKAQNKTRTLF